MNTKNDRRPYVPLGRLAAAYLRAHRDHRTLRAAIEVAGRMSNDTTTMREQLAQLHAQQHDARQALIRGAVQIALADQDTNAQDAAP